jgi:hypothetical protein
VVIGDLTFGDLTFAATDCCQSADTVVGRIYSFWTCWETVFFSHSTACHSQAYCACKVQSGFVLHTALPATVRHTLRVKYSLVLFYIIYVCPIFPSCDLKIYITFRDYVIISS